MNKELLKASISSKCISFVQTIIKDMPNSKCMNDIFTDDELAAFDEIEKSAKEDWKKTYELAVGQCVRDQVNAENQRGTKNETK